MTTAEQGLMLTVGWSDAQHNPLMLRALVQVDMACATPSPALTVEEMQPVAFAAKMALANVLRLRRKKRA